MCYLYIHVPWSINNALHYSICGILNYKTFYRRYVALYMPCLLYNIVMPFFNGLIMIAFNGLMCSLSTVKTSVTYTGM